MNILIVHNYYKIRGGEDVVFENEVEALKKKSSVNVFTYSVNNQETDGGFFHKIIFLGKILSGNRRVSNEILKIIKDKKIDIVHFHNVFPLITPFVYRFLKKHSNVKIVQTIHNFRFVCPSGLLFHNGKICKSCLMTGNFKPCISTMCYRDSKLFSFLYSYLIKKTAISVRNDIDLCLTLNDFAKSILVQAGFKDDKIKVRGNSLPDIQECKRLEGKHYLFIGRISQEKGLENAIKAFVKLPECDFMVAGTGPLYEELQEKYKDYQNIKFAGFTDGETKRDLFLNAKAVIIPSVLYENFPMVMIEAFRCGIPVISNAWGAIGGIATDNVNALLTGTQQFGRLSYQGALVILFLL
ncbi:MAG: glycosyltransferase family 4 protein [Spirochaetales bacterium]|nr:glycosyltransferase family 4 protein [Spirochaetales bacterium]